MPSHLLPKKKGDSFHLELVWRVETMKKGGVFGVESSRERSMEEGDVGVDTNSSSSCRVTMEDQRTSTSSLAVRKLFLLIKLEYLN